MIETSSLSVRLGKALVVEDATLSFRRGRVTAILGPNGAGKSSLIRALAGLVQPVAGAVTLSDAPLSSLALAERARRIGYLPQNGQPAWAVTVRDLVSLGRLPHRSRFAASTQSDEAAVEAALVATDLAALADRAIDSLSGGELARAKFARVLAGQPDWILADEPLANLDPPHARDVLALLNGEARGGAGVIVVLHQLNAALRVADDVVLIRDGRVLAAGDAEEVLVPARLEMLFGMSFSRLDTAQGKALVPAG